jgi:hypothetical protein
MCNIFNKPQNEDYKHQTYKLLATPNSLDCYEVPLNIYIFFISNFVSLNKERNGTTLVHRKLMLNKLNLWIAAHHSLIVST